MGIFDKIWEKPKELKKETSEEKIEKIMSELVEKDYMMISSRADDINKLVAEDESCAEMIAKKLIGIIRHRAETCLSDFKNQNNQAGLPDRLQNLFWDIQTFFPRGYGDDDLDQRIVGYISEDKEIKKFILESLPEGINPELREKFERTLS